MASQIAEASDRLDRRLRTPGAAIGFGIRERLRGPVDGHTERDDPVAQGAERLVQVAEEAFRAVARLRGR